MKDRNEILRICNKNSGKIVTSHEALKVFGYSNKTYIWDTQLPTFLTLTSPKLWKINAYAFMPICSLTPKEFGKYITIFVDRKKVCLYPRHKVPFWMLKEYGGTL